MNSETTYQNENALRLELFTGIQNCLVLRDTRYFDIESFGNTLRYQQDLASNKKRLVVFGNEQDKMQASAVLTEFHEVESMLFATIADAMPSLSNTVVLIWGQHTHLDAMALHLSTQKTKTTLEISLSALRNNVEYLKSLVPEETKILSMVKSHSYGSGIEEIGNYLEHIGVDYLGVAYADEGVQLRKAGVNIPILVMNVEQQAFEDCIDFELEPCMYDFNLLDSFAQTLNERNRTKYPVHIKIETGMNRLGFQKEDLDNLLQNLNSSDVLMVKSVYTHLATTDNPKSNFTLEQIQRFEEISEQIQREMPYSFDRHALNSEGVINFNQFAFDMVRIGIGMYGFTSNALHTPHLKPVVQWSSVISQVKKVRAGKTVGYGQAGQATKDTEIAIIPLGYADGFRRSLGNGKSGVYINNTFCPVLGNVCMDMIMVDLQGASAKAGDPVEIVGSHQTTEQVAAQMNTIPYEVLTGISRRVRRVYTLD